VEELVKRINEQLGGVEEIIDLNAKYQDAKIVKVVECGKHPNADRLSVCQIDAGSGDNIQVVCGATNVHAGMFAVWLPPESIVPSTFGAEDEFKLGSRELRGLMSNGMLASARELGIGDDHSGIVEINAEEWKPYDVEIAPGVSFARAYGLDDTVINIENKMFTHRPDLFGQLGVAREIAGILGRQFTSPEWYLGVPEFPKGDGLILEVVNEAPDKVPRFMAVAIKNVTVGPSPLWLQVELMRLGSKAINNIVDMTNYIMLTTAQPTHAYDYDKLRGSKIGARHAHSGEKITLLNNKTYELSEDDMVIVDGEGAIGLGGIMGGRESEVSFDTKNVVLEVANFDMYTVRKSSMRHGIFTDALTRFNKGQSALQNDRVLNVLLTGVIDTAGGEQGSAVYDLSTGNDTTNTVMTSAGFINDRLGLSTSAEEMKRLLENVEIKVNVETVPGHLNSELESSSVLHMTMPFWRTDIDQSEDIVEEVGRLYGFDKLPKVLPTRSIKPVQKNPRRELQYTLRDIFSRAGANEVLTYSFVHERVLTSAEQDATNSYQLSNALSPDLQYYRQSLTPSLLERVHPNIKAGYDEFALFEMNKVHDKSSGLNEEGVPVENNSLSLVYASKKTLDGAPFFKARAILEYLAERLKLKLAYEQLGSESTSPLAAPFEQMRAAIVTDTSTGLFLGVLGEYKKNVSRNFKLPDYAAGFELNIDSLLRASKNPDSHYQPPSRYPSVERDISLRVDANLAFDQVFRAIVDAFDTSELLASIKPVVIYQPDDSTTKSITFRVMLTSSEKTLTSEEVNQIVEDAVRQLFSGIGAEQI
jgi:phenylalanyl-tRNA synthetase beta chain